ncbi:MAG: hypothetical protein PHY09_08580 [Desulfuromonadaceae bacterium]|nr:hypothetical protein [Desulfuromonadaceae bacterium]MDD5106817.1 hypothetical protein [Desulfuromonadaceae bacterium]
MLYNLVLNYNGFHLILPLAVSIVFTAIMLAKEKSDERKRA